MKYLPSNIGSICKRLHFSFSCLPLRQYSCFVSYLSDITAGHQNATPPCYWNFPDVIDSLGLPATLATQTVMFPEHCNVHSRPHLWILLLRWHGHTMQIWHPRSRMQNLHIILGLRVMRYKIKFSNICMPATNLLHMHTTDMHPINIEIHGCQRLNVSTMQVIFIEGSRAQLKTIIRWGHRHLPEVRLRHASFNRTMLRRAGSKADVCEGDLSFCFKCIMRAAMASHLFKDAPQDTLQHETPKDVRSQHFPARQHVNSH